MKKLILALTAALLANSASAIPLPKFPEVGYNPLFSSIGYRLGYITDINWIGIVLWTYEGLLDLGVGTAPDQIVDRRCRDDYVAKRGRLENPEDRTRVEREALEECTIISNPWHFSFLDTAIYNQWHDLSHAAPVVVYYERPMISPKQIITYSKNFVYRIYPTNPNYDVPLKFSLATTDPLLLHAGPERSVVLGRVVKASYDHYLFKTHEIIVQQNLIGNNFITLSVSNTKMFDYIVSAMLTGKPLKIEFVRVWSLLGSLLGIRGYETNDFVISVEILTHGQAEGEPPGESNPEPSPGPRR